MDIGDREPWWRSWLPPILLLGSPWLAVSITAVIALMVNEVAPNSTAHRPIVFINLVLAAAGSAFGGMFVRGPLSMRVSVVIAVLLYALETYVVVLTIITNVFRDQIRT